MEWGELRQMCEADPCVVLRLGPPLSQGFTRRLLGKSGPRGEIVCGVKDSHQIVRFRSETILRWLDKNALSPKEPDSE